MENKTKFSQRYVLMGTAISLALFSAHANASGFQLFEYNATDIGLANSGGAAYAMDASTTFTNPAGLTRIQTPEIVASGVWVDGSGEFTGTSCGGRNCTPVPTEANGGTGALVPAGYFATPLGDNFAFGIGITAPFGLKTDYGTDTPIRYSATLSEIQTVDINPALAFKFNDHLSIGAGVSAQYFKATLNNNITPITGLPDSQIENNADDWAAGWNAGILYQFDEATRVGVSYRSEVQHDATGLSQMRNGVFINGNSDVSTSITLPPTTIISAYHAFNPQWSLMASAWYTQWNKIQDVTLYGVRKPDGTLVAGTYPNTAPGTVVLPQGFDNTWRFALGSEFNATQAWTLRAGVQVDSTPTNDTDRTVRLPESDRFTAGIGAGYRANKNVKFDAGYSHIWFTDDASINQTGPDHPLAQSSGTVSSYGNLYAVQATIDIT